MVSRDHGCAGAQDRPEGGVPARGGAALGMGAPGLADLHLGQWKAELGRPECESHIHLLCGPGQVTQPLWASAPPRGCGKGQENDSPIPPPPHLQAVRWGTCYHLPNTRLHVHPEGNCVNFNRKLLITALGVDRYLLPKMRDNCTNRYHKIHTAVKVVGYHSLRLRSVRGALEPGLNFPLEIIRKLRRERGYFSG